MSLFPLANSYRRVAAQRIATTGEKGRDSDGRRGNDGNHLAPTFTDRRSPPCGVGRCVVHQWETYCGVGSKRWTALKHGTVTGGTWRFYDGERRCGWRRIKE